MKFYKKPRKTPEEKKQKQLDMVKLEVEYEQYLAQEIAKIKDMLKNKYPQIKTLYEGWLYGVYVAILDNQQAKEKKGKLYYLFNNIPEKTNKYKLSYTIDNENNSIFNIADLKQLPKSYISILKRHHLDLNTEKSNISKLVCAHIYKLEENVYIHHSDYNKLNNSIKNLVPLEKEFFDSLGEEKQKSLAKAQQYIPEKYKLEFKKKAKDVIKMEYRACELYYTHRLPVEKVAATLRNRLDKAAVQRVVKLYPYFNLYSKMDINTEEK